MALIWENIMIRTHLTMSKTPAQSTLASGLCLRFSPCSVKVQQTNVPLTCRSLHPTPFTAAVLGHRRHRVQNCIRVSSPAMGRWGRGTSSSALVAAVATTAHSCHRPLCVAACFCLLCHHSLHRSIICFATDGPVLSPAATCLFTVTSASWSVEVPSSSVILAASEGT